MSDDGFEELNSYHAAMNSQRSPRNSTTDVGLSRAAHAYGNLPHSQTVGGGNGYTRLPGGGGTTAAVPGGNQRWKPSVFDFNKSGGTCPTCQGTGRIPKGDTHRERVEYYSFNSRGVFLSAESVMTSVSY